MLREDDGPVINALKPLLIALHLAVVSHLPDAIAERLALFHIFGFGECRARGYGWCGLGRRILLRDSGQGNGEQQAETDEQQECRDLVSTTRWNATCKGQLVSLGEIP